MPKVVEKAVIEQIENQIAFYKRSIDRYKVISRGGKEGNAAALELMKEVRNTTRQLHDELLSKPNHVKMLRVVGLAGEERAYNHMITMLEGAKPQIQFYQEQIDAAETQLKELRKLHIREE